LNRPLHAIGFLSCLLLSVTVRADTAEAPRGMVATVHPLATQAGVERLRAGGNAVDAAVAAALMLGVVDGHNSGIGGGCFIVMRLADGRQIAIDGREMAPGKASRDMYVRDDKVLTEASLVGPLAVGVPGALAAYAHAAKKYGRSELAELLDPAAEVAEEGFAIDRVYAARLEGSAKLLARFPASRATLLKENGEPYREGETIRQKDLAATYRAIARHGPGWFYHGPFARRAGEWMQSHGGILTAEDFAAYEAKERQPVVSRYRGYTVLGFPPPSSGGTHVAQILNILENFDLGKTYAQDPAAAAHIVAEAMKLAFADRAHWLGDPDFAKVPRGLIDPEYAARLAEKIDREKVTHVKRHGTPPRHAEDLFGHTTHIAAADSEGNWIAMTTSLNTAFGSKLMVPGTGVLLNNHMNDFSLRPGVPNAYGLVGAEANAIAPGKRPLSSMSPTMVLKDGRPVMTVGAAGGPKIITQVVLAIVRTVDRKMPLPEAIAAPRFHHQWSPDVLYHEDSLDMDLLKSLRCRGHKLEKTGHVGVTQAIRWLPPQEKFLGVSDPRVPGNAAGF